MVNNLEIKNTTMQDCLETIGNSLNLFEKTISFKLIKGRKYWTIYFQGYVVRNEDLLTALQESIQRIKKVFQFIESEQKQKQEKYKMFILDIKDSKINNEYLKENEQRTGVELCDLVENSKGEKGLITGSTKEHLIWRKVKKNGEISSLKNLVLYDDKDLTVIKKRQDIIRQK